MSCCDVVDIKTKQVLAATWEMQTTTLGEEVLTARDGLLSDSFHCMKIRAK
jgi:hypothetical protein